MKLNAALKQWAIDNLDIAKDADDSVFENAINEAVKSGRLEITKFSELLTTKNADEDAETPLKQLESVILKNNESLIAGLTHQPGSSTNPLASLAKGGDGAIVKVYGASHQFRSNRKEVDFGTKKVHSSHLTRPHYHPSELDCVKTAVLFKTIAKRLGQPVELSEFETQLLNEMVNEDRWCGEAVDGKSHNPKMVKTLLSDGTSGGVNLVPEFFDQQIVTQTVLHGELMPYVQMVEVPRGDTVDGASIGSVTVSWGAEGTAATPFDTASLVSSLDTSIFPLQFFVKIGRDFLADAAVDIGQIIINTVSERHMQQLDNVVATGNGTTQPLGLTNAAGTTAVDAATGGAWALTDLVNLQGGLSKPFHASAMNPCFVVNNTTYSRFRSEATGVTGDSRLIHGMDYSSFQLMERPAKIVTTLPNNTAIFAALSRYRLYRRKGFSVEQSTQGQNLMLENSALFAMRGRYGGRLVEVDACAIVDDGQS